MKRIIFLMVSVFAFSTISILAQSESVKPTYGVIIERDVSFAIINDKDCSDVTVELRAAQILDYFANGVRVVVRDSTTGKVIYRSRYSQSYLYAFSDGMIQVGKGNALTQIILYKSDDKWFMRLRAKGIY